MLMMALTHLGLFILIFKRGQLIKPETKFWHELKRTTPKITWTRLENASLLGTPDLLGYNSNQYFFTVELKVANGNKVRLSPHQISFHIRHPENTFILVKTKAACRLWVDGHSLVVGRFGQ